MKMRRFHVAALMALAAMAFLGGCGDPVVAGARYGAQVPTLMPNDVKGVNNGFFYQDWDNDRGSPTLIYANQAAGRYTLTWNGTANDWNFVNGKGWGSWEDQSSTTPPSLDKVVSYSGTFNPNPKDGDYVNAYLDFYGWANDYDIEYYVLESYGEFNPSMDSAYTNLGSFTSHGINYDIYRANRNGPSPKGPGNYDFVQLFSIRTPRLEPGSVSGTIYLADHVAQWAGYGYTLTSTQFQLMATEGYGAVGGNSDITVSEGSSGGGDGFSSLAGRSVTAGSLYVGLGEWRTPVIPDDDLVLGGLFIGMNFHSVSGSSVDVELVMVPLDSATESQVRAEKDPPESAYAGMSFSGAAGARACFKEYNASPLAVSAYRGWETMSSDGMTIDLGDFNFNGIPVSDFVMTYTHISDDPEAGLPRAQISYDYSYSVDGKAMTADGNIFVSRNPPVILPSIKILLQENAVPDAMVSGDAYSLVSAWSGKHVTVTASGSNAAVKAQPVNEGWTSQDWVAEFVSGKERTVRLRNIWTGKYLHAQSNEENAKVVCFDLHADWLSEQWEIEQTGLLEVRFRNLWTNRYLTVVDNGNYADIILKQLNTGWASQRWDVDWLVWHQ